MKKRTILSLIASAVLAGSSMAAQNVVSTESNAVAVVKQTAERDAAVRAAEQKMKMTFTNLSVVGFSESPIKGVYEMNMGSNVAYYYPSKDLIIFGEIYDKAGNNLTHDSRMKAMRQTIDSLDFSDSIVIGDPNGIEMIEFTDPECGFCLRAENALNQLESQFPIKRRIVFATFRARPHLDPNTGRVLRPASHPDALKKMEHIICSEDQEQAYRNVMNDTVTDYKSCDKAVSVLKNHDKIVSKLGVKGTPSFFLDDQFHEGIDDKVIDTMKAVFTQKTSK